MTIDLWIIAALGGCGFAAGLIGALLGLGGGIFLVPALTLGLGLPFGVAAGTSLVAVAATSAAGSSTYVRTRLTNIRLGVLLGPATVAAASGAALVAQAIDGRILRALFAGLLIYTAASMLRAGQPAAQPAARPDTRPAELPAGAWQLAGSYEDAQLGETVRYTAGRLPLGLAASLLGGTLSGLLGVGGGIVQVPVMHLLMGVPLKVATGTSSFLIGITAAASALIYYAHDRINPVLAAPAALAVLGGARLGATLVQRLPSGTLKRIFAVVALLVALQMLLQAVDACPWCASVPHG
ncbi:MAG TPA: sulfite exporter TauE/SafE family protein [Chloroflexia bacterium]|nr:sulfite exporter TauE/SafE family protein [Chloroflexia bacterium]